MLCCLSFRPVSTALAAIPASTNTRPTPKTTQPVVPAPPQMAQASRLSPIRMLPGSTGMMVPATPTRMARPQSDGHDSLGVHGPSLGPGPPAAVRPAPCRNAGA